MPAERMSMRKIREVLRLTHEMKLSLQKTATSCNTSKRSVERYLQRAKDAGLAWPLPDDLDDKALEKLLYPKSYKTNQLVPDWADIHRELKQKGMTQQLLWEEYRQREPECLGYSRFCQLYRAFKSTLTVSMRQTHIAGEKCFVDYAGMTVPWIDRSTGEERAAQIFVAVLGASNYTFVEATASQQLPDWIGSHVRAFEFFGGVTTILVPDNLKSGVTKAHHYDPDTNPTYQEMADHYGVAVVPARALRPQDKAKVEVGVQGIERRILAPLRNRQFFSISEINEAIKSLLSEYNNRAFQKLPGTRSTEFARVDQPALKALPSTRYQYAQWKKARVGIDYHIEFERHYYSVPYKYNKRELDLRISSTLIECFYQSKQIAVHKRSYRPGYTTIKEHMPKGHQIQAEWTSERLTQWARKSGPETEQLIQNMIASRAHPEQAFRACLGVMRLGQSYGAERLEQAAKRANHIGGCRYQSIESILKKGLDQQPLPDLDNQKSANDTTTQTHQYIRGSSYYD